MKPRLNMDLNSIEAPVLAGGTRSHCPFIYMFSLVGTTSKYKCHYSSKMDP